MASNPPSTSSTASSCAICECSPIAATSIATKSDLCESCLRGIYEKAACSCAQCQQQRGQQFTNLITFGSGDVESPASAGGSQMLARVASFRETLPLNRIKACVRLGYVPTTFGEANGYTMHSSYDAEVAVCREFFAEMDTYMCNYLDVRWRTVDISGYFFPTWMLFELIVNCAKNHAHDKGRMFWMDGTSWPVAKGESFEERALSPFCIKCPVFARLEYDMNVEILRLSQMVAESQLDEIEEATLLLLIFVHYGSPLFEGHEMCGSMRARVFKELEEYYADSDLELIQRFDVIASLLGEFHKAATPFMEIHVMYDLMYEYSCKKASCIVKGYRHWKSCRDRICLQ